MALEKMLLFALLVLIAVRDIKPQGVSCVEDVHCMDGSFCVEQTRSCHECLRCDNLGRSPSSIESACIKSGVQCGPCLQGLIIVDANWVGMCTTPNTRSWKLMSSYLWILVAFACACAAIGALLYIVHDIWNIHTNVDIEISSSTKVYNKQIELTV